MGALGIYISDSFDSYFNMSVERYLTETVPRGEIRLFLWRNERTVFVGRNQNCWSECRVSLLEGDGGKLARRLSGGGAVYHDIGNLNFTFIASREAFDIPRQCRVIAEAVGKFGLSAAVSGRNDILVDGAKFSGNAFWRCEENQFHHGTILINTDTEAMAKYLTVPEDKLRAKGVASVRSRVVNLAHICPQITAESMTEAVAEAFCSIYGGEGERRALPNKEILAPIITEFCSPDWKYGRTPAFTHSFGGRFSWGGIKILLDVKGGRVADCHIDSDMLDVELAEQITSVFKGKRYDRTELCISLGQISPSEGDTAVIIEDICRLVENEI